MRMKLGRLGVLAVAVLSVLGSGAGRAVAAEGAGDSGRVVVMISLDGLAGYYMDDPKAEMPTLREMAKEGARAESMRASTPTVTWTNHATLMTGVEPAKHGVVGNNYIERATGKRVTLIGDPELDKDQLVRVPTIYDVAHEAGMKTAAVRWPASRHAKNLDWTMPDVMTVDLWKRYSTPSLLEECERAGIRPDQVKEEADKDGSLTSAQWRDEEWVKAFKLILREHRPRLAMLHLANVDHQEHLNGPRSAAAYAAIKAADAQVRDVWEEAKRDFPGRVAMVVVSDHGFSPVHKQIFPNVILRNAGLVEVKGTRIVGGPVQVMGQGGAAFVYINEKADRGAVMEKVRKAFEGVEGVEKVAGPEEMKAYGVGDAKDDPRVPDMMLFSQMGYIFGDTAGGALAFRDKPERLGSHGHDADFPELHATFVAWGDGVKKGVKVGEISNMDVAPTVARLLGLEMKGVDGKVLEGVLEK